MFSLEEMLNSQDSMVKLLSYLSMLEKEPQEKETTSVIQMIYSDSKKLDN